MCPVKNALKKEAGWRGHEWYPNPYLSRAPWGVNYTETSGTTLSGALVAQQGCDHVDHVNHGNGQYLGRGHTYI